MNTEVIADRNAKMQAAAPVLTNVPEGCEVDADRACTPGEAFSHGQRMAQRYTKRGFPYECIGVIAATETKVLARIYPRDGRSCDYESYWKTIGGFQAIMKPLCDPTGPPVS